MSEAKLDQIVKGAPPPDVTIPDVVATSNTDDPSSRFSRPHTFSSYSPGGQTPSPTDPLSTLPTSPPQIYLNLLILEASLRAQYLTLLGRRRQHTFFLTLLLVWILYFGYCLFLRPREDGSGVGGSVYWVVDMTEKVAFMGGLLTALLIWATGQWERGVRWPRRWVGITNRGLRGMNLKIVIIKGPWYGRVGGWLAFLFPYSSFFGSHNGSSYHFVEISHGSSNPKHSYTAPSQPQTNKFSYRDGHSSSRARLEDTAAGGDSLKLLLLPKPFGAEFRENWELYRTEYWERENERRRELRQLIQTRHREEARKQYGWLWWLRGQHLRQDDRPASYRPSSENERSHHHRLSSQLGQVGGQSQHSRQASLRKRRPSVNQGQNHSRSSSRSSRSSTVTSAIDADEFISRPSTAERRAAARKPRSSMGKSQRPNVLQEVSDEGNYRSQLSMNSMIEADKRASMTSIGSASSMSEEGEELRSVGHEGDNKPA